MFEWEYWWESYYGSEHCSSYEPCSLEEAIKAIQGNEDSATIKTEAEGTVVFEDGEWLMTKEEAEALSIEEEAEKEKRKNAREAEAAAERETVGDATDKENISLILAIANKYPARDNGATRAGEEIRSIPGWKTEISWKATEAEVVHKDSGRHYNLNMWRGTREVKRVLIHQ